MHIKNVKKEQIFKAQTVWPKNFQECLLICKQQFMEFNGEVYDLDKPINEKISKGSFGRNGFRIIKSLNYPHLDK